MFTVVLDFSGAVDVELAVEIEKPPLDPDSVEFSEGSEIDIVGPAGGAKQIDSITKKDNDIIYKLIDFIKF